jgi:hypothetical protein
VACDLFYGDTITGCRLGLFFTGEHATGRVRILGVTAERAPEPVTQVADRSNGSAAQRADRRDDRAGHRARPHCRAQREQRL